MIEIKGNTEGAVVNITGIMNTSDMLIEAVGAALAVIGAIASVEGEVIARAYANAVVKTFSDDEAVADCIKQGIEAAKQ